MHSSTVYQIETKFLKYLFDKLSERKKRQVGIRNHTLTTHKKYDAIYAKNN